MRLLLLGLPLAAAVGLIWTTGLADLFRALALAATVIVWGFAMRRHWPGAGGSVQAIQFEGPGRCRLCRADGLEERAAVADALALPWLVIVSLTGEHGRRALVIPVDALDAESHRRLRREIRTW